MFAQVLLESGPAVQRAVGAGQHRGDPVVDRHRQNREHHPPQQVVAAFEGVVETRQRHPRMRADAAGGGVLDAVLGDHLECRFDQCLSAVFDGHAGHGFTLGGTVDASGASGHAYSR
nr:hypothetical protein [Gordonia amarae]